MFRLRGIERDVSGRTLFSALDLDLHRGDRVGLIGPNGCGKTSLLRIVAGELEPDRGSIHAPRGWRVAYLPQEVESQVQGEAPLIEAVLAGADAVRDIGRNIERLSEKLADEDLGEDERDSLVRDYGELRAIYEWSGGDALESRARVVLGGLGFAADEMNRPMRTFSGGWRMRALMARLLMSGADLLLLDEPTNHLDLEALGWLETHLARSPAALLLVSHDRFFLDRVCSKIADLDLGRIRVTRGGYTAWRKARATGYELAVKRDEKLGAEQKRLQRFVDRFGYKATKASQANARKKRIESIAAERAELDLRVEKTEGFRLPQPPPRDGTLMVLDEVDAGYGTKKVLESVHLDLRAGDRIAVTGPNGAGKTTLLRLLAGDLLALGGRLERARGLLVGRFAQHQLEDLDPEETVESQALEVDRTSTPERVRTALGALGLGRDHFERKVSTLSGGERARLALARLLLRPCHLLLLDEPTNHLDLPMREALEQALAEWPGALIVVSHDRAFLERVTRESLRVDAGALERQSSVDLVAKPKSRNSSAEGDDDAKISDDADPRSRAARRLRAEAVQERSRRIRPLRDRVASLESEIEAADLALEELDRQLADPEIHRDGQRAAELTRQRVQTADRAAGLTEEWESLAEELEELERE